MDRLVKPDFKWIIRRASGLRGLQHWRIPAWFIPALSVLAIASCWLGDQQFHFWTMLVAPLALVNAIRTRGDASGRGPAENHLTGDEPLAQDRQAEIVKATNWHPLKRPERYEIEAAAELRCALEQGDIMPWFQPQISLTTGEVIGMEALARWRHRNRGIVLPAAFLPTVDTAGAYQNLGQTMLRGALSALRLWDSLDCAVPSVSINCSADELRDPREDGSGSSNPTRDGTRDYDSKKNPVITPKA